METLGQLSSRVTSLVKAHFKHFKSEQKQICEAYNKFLKDNLFTDSGNRRYPKYVQTALNCVFSEMMELHRSEKLVFCYKVDGKLFTTFNKHKVEKYLFTGKTDIPNYRENSDIEEKVLHSEYSESGLYYPCGKPFYSQSERKIK